MYNVRCAMNNDKTQCVCAVCVWVGETRKCSQTTINNLAAIRIFLGQWSSTFCIFFQLHSLLIRTAKKKVVEKKNAVTSSYLSACL